MVGRGGLGDASGSSTSGRGDRLPIVAFEIKSDSVELPLPLGIETGVLAVHPVSTFVSLSLCPLAQRIVAYSPFQVAVLLFVGTESFVVLLPQLIIMILLLREDFFGGVIFVVAYVVIDVVLESRQALESLVTIRTLVVESFDVSPCEAIWQTESLCEGLGLSRIDRIGVIFLLLVFASACGRGSLCIVTVVGIDISLVILLPIKANTAAKNREQLEEKQRTGC